MNPFVLYFHSWDLMDHLLFLCNFVRDIWSLVRALCLEGLDGGRRKGGLNPSLCLVDYFEGEKRVDVLRAKREVLFVFGSYF